MPTNKPVPATTRATNKAPTKPADQSTNKAVNKSNAVDSAFMAYCEAKNEVTFNAFYAKLRQFLKVMQDADDLVQEVALAVWQRVSSGPPLTEPLHWFGSVVSSQKRFERWAKAKRCEAEAAVAINVNATYVETPAIDEEDAREHVLSKLTPEERDICVWLSQHSGRVPRTYRDRDEKARATKRRVTRLVDNEFGISA